MQQTQSRGFHIIERDDAFSPEALNDNTRKIEAALDAHQAAVKELTDGLDERVKVFEAKRFVCGICDASLEVTVDLGFTPIAVAVHQIQGGLTGVTGLVVTGQGNHGGLEIVEGGFYLNTQYGMSGFSGPYTYIAFG